MIKGYERLGFETPAFSDLCEEMGLSPNTEAYGKCILKLMD